MAKKEKEAKGDSPNAGPGPVGNEKIAADDERYFEEPHKSYPWTPFGKEALPEDAPSGLAVDHYNFPFMGRIVKTLQFRRDEERVNKNPHATPTFVEKLKAAYAADEGPKAPPKVPGQPDVETVDDLPPPKGHFFPEFIAGLKKVFPELKQTFTDPPTYIWNPKEGPTSKLDAKKIKDSIKMKYPKLLWTTSPDSTESAQVAFDDGTYADVQIGSVDADHLTITYRLK